jgi:AcrR family transcriptional regulator
VVLPAGLVGATSTDQRRARGQRNRQALVAAAIEQFARHGYHGTTVEQIAAAAGVAPRTFFHHFAAKDDVLFDGYADRLTLVAQRFRASRSTSLWAALREVSAVVAREMAAQPELFLLRARLYADVPALRATMLRINEEWIDQVTAEVAARLGTQPCADLTPRLVASLVNGANRAAIEVWVAGGARADLGRLMSQALEALRPTLRRLARATVPTGEESVS